MAVKQEQVSLEVERQQAIRLVVELARQIDEAGLAEVANSMDLENQDLEVLIDYFESEMVKMPISLSPSRKQQVNYFWQQLYRLKYN